MRVPVAKALFNSHTYPEYRKLVSDLLLEDKSTGNEQSKDLTNYSALNQTRMNRLDKTMEIANENCLKLRSLKREYIWLVIAEGWCGDTAQILPILNKMTMASGNKIELKIVLRDENEELMNLFLTNKVRVIPIVIAINKETGNALGSWGPRPIGAADFIKNYKKEFGVIDEIGKNNLQLWYLKDKGLSTQEELINLMLDLES